MFAPRFIMEESEYIRLFKRDFISKSDQEHIDSWKNIVEWTSFSNYLSNQLESVVLEFVDNVWWYDVKPFNMCLNAHRQIVKSALGL